MFKSLAEALKKAGYQSDKPAESPAARLETMMAQAIATGGGLEDQSLDVFRRRLIDSADFELVWTLCEEVRAPAIRKLFQIVLWRIRQQNRDLFPDDRVSATAGRSAPPPPSQPPRQTTPSVPMAPARPPASPTTAVGRSLAEHRARRERQSWLDKFTVNGRPIGDVDPREAAAVKHLRARDARFIHLLLARVTPGTSLTIRECVDDEEADQLWLQANDETQGDRAA